MNKTTRKTPMRRKTAPARNVSLGTLLKIVYRNAMSAPTYKPKSKTRSAPSRRKVTPYATKKRASSAKPKKTTSRKTSAIPLLRMLKF